MSSPKADKYSDIADDFRAAVALRDAGDLAEARRQLENLIGRRPEAAFLHGTLGGIQLDLGDIGAAVEHFGRASQLSTTSELASLGFFHALLKAGRTRDAFDEMRRFTAIRASAEYTDLEVDLRRELGDAEYERLAAEGATDS
jgi:predicted Zn-dependent protease